jgi:signal peptidase I
MKDNDLNNSIADLCKSQQNDISLRVVGNSMHPLMPLGSKVTVRPCTAETLRKGDIITFVRDGIIDTHRIVKYKRKKDKLEIIEKGDNKLSISYVSGNEILGKAVSIQSASGEIDLGSRKWRILNRLVAGYSFLSYKFYRCFYRSLAGKKRSKPLSFGFYTRILNLNNLFPRMLSHQTKKK